MENIANTNEYFNFFNEVKERIRKTQYEAHKKVNVELIQFNMYDGMLFRHLIIRLLDVIHNSLKIRDGIPFHHTC